MLVSVLTTLQHLQQSLLLLWHSARRMEVHFLPRWGCWLSGSAAASSIVSLPFHEILPARYSRKHGVELGCCFDIRKQGGYNFKKLDLHTVTVTADCSGLLETCMRKQKVL